MQKQYDIAILGGGPGGYVAAIRAGQLGFKTVVIDKDNLGGICLNWGCIPTKSLLKNAEIYDNIKNHGEDFGIKTTGLDFDFNKIIKRSRDVSDRISKNVELLIKKNKVDRIRGLGKFISMSTIEISDEKEKVTETIKTDKIIIATGARPEIFRRFRRQENIITSTEAMILEKLPKI
jgi:dihydrolipoamide dehydrogenase